MQYNRVQHFNVCFVHGTRICAVVCVPTATVKHFLRAALAYLTIESHSRPAISATDNPGKCIDLSTLLIGAAHFPSTSAWYENIGVSAHNVNFDGTPGYFLNLYTLNIGDVIIYQTAHGRREYIIETIIEICEYDWSFLDRTRDNRITLITCITGKPELRLVVQAAERIDN